MRYGQATVDEAQSFGFIGFGSLSCNQRRCEIADLLMSLSASRASRQVVADRYPEAAAAFNHGEDRGHTRSGLLAANMDPVFLPNATPRMEFSARLLLSSSCGCSRKHVSFFHSLDRVGAASPCRTFPHVPSSSARIGRLCLRGGASCRRRT